MDLKEDPEAIEDGLAQQDGKAIKPKRKKAEKRVPGAGPPPKKAKPSRSEKQDKDAEPKTSKGKVGRPKGSGVIKAKPARPQVQSRSILHMFAPVSSSSSASASSSSSSSSSV